MANISCLNISLSQLPKAEALERIREIRRLRKIKVENPHKVKKAAAKTSKSTKKKETQLNLVDFAKTLTDQERLDFLRELEES